MRSVEFVLQQRRQIAWIITPLDLFTRTRDDFARSLDGKRIGALPRKLVNGRKVTLPHGERLLRN
jgi:hypothetical protein